MSETMPDTKGIKRSSIEQSNEEVSPGKHEDTNVSEEYEIFKRTMLVALEFGKTFTNSLWAFSL